MQQPQTESESQLLLSSLHQEASAPRPQRLPRSALQGATSQVLPTSLVLRLLNDPEFAPGRRPEHFYDQCGRQLWVFKEVVGTDNTRLQKRPKGSDTWVNSGGKRGGRVLVDKEGKPVARRRYGTIKVVKSDFAGATALRYQQYTRIHDGEEDVLTRLFHVQEVDPKASGAPIGHFTVPPEISLTQSEQEEIDNSGEGMSGRRLAKMKRQLKLQQGKPAAAVALKLIINGALIWALATKILK